MNTNETLTVSSGADDKSSTNTQRDDVTPAADDAAKPDGIAEKKKARKQKVSCLIVMFVLYLTARRY